MSSETPRESSGDDREIIEQREQSLEMFKSRAAQAIKTLATRPEFGFGINEMLDWPLEEWEGFTGKYELDSNENLCAEVMSYFVSPKTSPEDTFESRREALRKAL